MTTIQNRPVKLMTARQISDEYGLPEPTARNYLRRIAREDGVVRLPGMRRMFVRREDVERRMKEAGCLKRY